MDSAAVLALVRESTGAERITSFARIQTLWSGYGELSRAHLVGGHVPTVIVKWAKAPTSSGGVHRATDASDRRKRRSYEVEGCFYREFAARTGMACRVPALLAHAAGRDEWMLVLEDLDAERSGGYAARESNPSGVALDACLSWLATFHATFLSVSPKGLWPVGTYWHLATRREELERARESPLRRAAHDLDRALSGARFQSIVHGDAKPDNFCFAHDRRSVAAVDFQYVGGGVGVKDVAYMLHGTGARVAARALDGYFAHLRARLSPDVDGEALEREWRALYPVAEDDFRRFLEGWRR